jgi:hypothetical protein
MNKSGLEVFEDDFFKSNEVDESGQNLIKAKALPVGTVRDWKGRKYKKTAQGWQPVSTGKGSKWSKAGRKKKDSYTYSDTGETVTGRLAELNHEIDRLFKENKKITEKWDKKKINWGELSAAQMNKLISQKQKEYNVVQDKLSKAHIEFHDEYKKHEQQNKKTSKIKLQSMIHDTIKKFERNEGSTFSEQEKDTAHKKVTAIWREKGKLISAGEVEKIIHDI